MFGLGMSEIIFLGILALIVIGPKELPELARTLGRFINELKRSTNILGEEIKNQARVDRINFSEPPAANHSEQSESPIEPQQMDLVEQTNLENKLESSSENNLKELNSTDKKEEQKRS